MLLTKIIRERGIVAHKLGLSGSITLSDPNKFTELFQGNLDHIEIGEFQDEDSFQYFLKLLRGTNKSFGLHSPLYRNQSKYDLLEKVFYAPKQAWRQFEVEVEKMSALGAEYVLVHFPYFKEEITGNVNQLIEDGLQKLSTLQEKYGISIVCEPKLGLNRSAVGIRYLDNFPLEIWEKYGIHLCIDIGDYLMAVGDKAMEFIRKWKKYIKVVHLHNVEFPGEKYIWVPVHPSHEGSEGHFSIKKILLLLAECEDIYFVFEHTPHSNPTEEFVHEGINWVRNLLEI